MDNEETNKLFLLFKEWAEDHLGQGYSLELDEGTFIDPVTRWAFAGFRAGFNKSCNKDFEEGYMALLFALQHIALNSEHIDGVAKYAELVIGHDWTKRIYGKGHIYDLE